MTTHAAFILKVELSIFELLPPIGDDFESAAILLDLVLVSCGPSLLFIGDGNDRNPDDQSSTTERLPCLLFHASIRLQEVRRLAQELSIVNLDQPRSHISPEKTIFWGWSKPPAVPVQQNVQMMLPYVDYHRTITCYAWNTTSDIILTEVEDIIMQSKVARYLFALLDTRTRLEASF